MTDECKEKQMNLAECEEYRNEIRDIAFNCIKKTTGIIRV